MTYESFLNNDMSKAVRVEPLSEAVKKLVEIIKSHHVDRLQDGNCSIEGGVYLFDLLNCFERIASHSSNISLHVIKRLRNDRDFDEMHGHANDSFSEEYKALYRYYESRYIDPILVPLSAEERERLLRESEERDNALRKKDEESEPVEIEIDEKAEKTAKAVKNKKEKSEKAAKEKADKEKDKSEKTSKDKASKEKGDKEKSAKKKSEKDKIEKSEKDAILDSTDKDKSDKKNSGGKKNKK